MSRNPVRRRKSPYRHDVSNHVRQGRPVQKYERGRGGKPALNPRRRRVVGGVSPLSHYDVTIVYVGTEEERLDVDAKDYVSALDSGMGSREGIQSPRKIRLRRGS